MHPPARRESMHTDSPPRRSLTRVDTAPVRVRSHVKDPEAQKVIAAAMRDIKAMHGEKAAESQLEGLVKGLEKSKVAA